MTAEKHQTLSSLLDDRDRLFLKNNFSKTKEMLTDFREKPPPGPPVFIHRQTVEVVQRYQNFRTINSRFAFKAGAICAMAHQRVYGEKVLLLFYQVSFTFFFYLLV